MVEVTRLNGSRFALNPDLIARVHESPDTTIVMLDGSRYIVVESMHEVIERIEGARARVLVLASEGLAAPAGPAAALTPAAESASTSTGEA